ncbi:outer membrane receptor protein involved in Fe transport [Dysgonomonas alginatilytica]|uniref:Outer membrane receptor protein involved in Fe transport n=1 Tax=Dysgonomonas alginatilytica TaxID=1605892 RepID=A0A2V3PQR4_9BACT|nr:TonB-dependent receptor plug domain-containing protein [Dysgonomonas alginatilytica]PXV66321.1 outer membrane receptor protein involved in Fe transport [Dysgonomonas alginatilytica]
MKSAILTFILLIIAVTASGQIAKGKITNQNGKPIEGVQIFNARTNQHTHSNEFGVFTLDKTAQNDILSIGGLGYKTLEIKANISETETVILDEDVLRLEEVVIHPKLAGLNFITAIDLKVTPVNSSQEILRKVPGLFIGQHAGGGKAEQLFLRGFDLDHGTDIAISVDGMPVNMVSHAHGQGYADLHFLIPETVDKIDFGKGPYYADKGDFATAGYVAFKTKEKLDKSTVGVELGQFNTKRIIGMFNILDQDKANQDAYIATEYLLTDGPFDAPQHFKRINLFGKYTSRFNDNSKFSLTVSHFTSKWDASGQIPLRLVNDGTISWFGAVDDTEGGNTSRTNVNAAYFKAIDDNTYFKANTFYSKYKFELYSNFTFFLEDPINGDQIRQKESRDIFGLNTEWGKTLDLGDVRTSIQGGVGFRADAIKGSELSRTKERYITLSHVMLGDIDQSNIFAYANAQFELGKLTIAPALRIDQFQFNYQDRLDTVYKNKGVQKTLVSPKLNFIYSENNNLQFYLKSGLGFHSNDTRVVVTDKERKTVPRAFGSDLGSIWKPIPRLIVNSALWYLYSEQEFVYVGDAGIIEPSGKSRRMGADLGIRYQLNNWLFFDVDANYAFARSIDEPKGENYIPLAPDFTSTAGLGLNNWNGFSGSLRFRFMNNRPANEDKSIMADGFAIFDVNLNYQYKGLLVGMSIENLFDTKWKETQFATESRLQNEATSVEEIHFTPGTPFFFRTRVAYNF